MSDRRLWRLTRTILIAVAVIAFTLLVLGFGTRPV
jgi:hypothetical protein